MIHERSRSSLVRRCTSLGRSLRRPALAAGLVCGALSVSGCTGAYADGSTEQVSALSVAQFPDVPVPDGLDLQTNLNQTFSYESSDYRIGEFVYRGPATLPEIRDYVVQNMPQYGWQQQALATEASTRSENGVETEVALEFTRWPYRVTYKIEDPEDAPSRLVVTYHTDYRK